MNEYEEEDLTLAPMSRRELAQLGDGEVAYIKQLDPEVAEKLFPALQSTPRGIDLFAVLGADGTPLALTDSRNAAIANAIENDLVPVSVAEVPMKARRPQYAALSNARLARAGIKMPDWQDALRRYLGAANS